jgi:hypothetical protein
MSIDWGLHIQSALILSLLCTGNLYCLTTREKCFVGNDGKLPTRWWPDAYRKISGRNKHNTLLSPEILHQRTQRNKQLVIKSRLGRNTLWHTTDDWTLPSLLLLLSTKIPSHSKTLDSLSSARQTTKIQQQQKSQRMSVRTVLFTRRNPSCVPTCNCTKTMTRTTKLLWLSGRPTEEQLQLAHTTTHSPTPLTYQDDIRGGAVDGLILLLLVVVPTVSL